MSWFDGDTRITRVVPQRSYKTLSLYYFLFELSHRILLRLEKSKRAHTYSNVFPLRHSASTGCFYMILCRHAGPIVIQHSSSVFSPRVLYTLGHWKLQVIKIIWHKAASLQHTDGLIVFARWRQSAPHRHPYRTGYVPCSLALSIWTADLSGQRPSAILF